MLAAFSLFCFPQWETKQSSLSHTPWPAFCLWSLSTSFALTATQQEVGASHKVREVWIWHVVCWVCQQANLEDPWVRFIPWLTGRLLHEIQNAVSKNHIPLMLSLSLICTFLICSLSQFMELPVEYTGYSERWMSLWKPPVQQGKPGIYSLALSSCKGEIIAISFRPKLLLLGEGSSWSS